MTDLRALEHSTLKVPYEILNKKFRFAQKTIDREIDAVQKYQLQNLEKVLADEKITVAEALKAVEAVEYRVDALQARVGDAVREERAAAQAIHARINHLKVHMDDNISEAEAEEWRRQRVDRLIIEYLLRAGSYQTAIALAQRSHLEYLSNLNVFLTAQEVEDSLRRGETGRALEWCADNKSKLRRLQSRLELRIREQEFIELLRAGEKAKAIEYSRIHFKDMDEKLWREELGAVHALLAFRPDTKVEKYAAFYREERRRALVDEFLAENFRLYQLAHQSVFSACLQAGLSALKTPECGSAKPTGRTNGCPVCIPEVLKLGESLPFAHASQSRLVCAASGEAINENNPSLMLPNGYVYGRNALQRNAIANNGRIVCPRTGKVFDPNDLQRVFVM